MKALIALYFFCLPLKNLSLTSAYGYRVHPVTGKFAFHAGVDLRANHDTVFAILNGVTTSVDYDPLLGVSITLRHGIYTSAYGHLSQCFIHPADSVIAGEPIGITGHTGRVTGEHLHFSIRYGKRYINPLNFLYQILKTTDHEQKFQTTARTDRKQADR